MICIFYYPRVAKAFSPTLYGNFEYISLHFTIYHILQFITFYIIFTFHHIIFVQSHAKSADGNDGGKLVIMFQTIFVNLVLKRTNTSLVENVLGKTRGKWFFRETVGFWKNIFLIKNVDHSFAQFFIVNLHYPSLFLPNACKA